MSVFPPRPVDPEVFFEESVPALFAEVVLQDAERDLELKVGVVLISGDEEGRGGEWTLSLRAGELNVVVGRSPDCDLTIVQRVADWRSALWEGRPGLIADVVATMISAGPEALRPPGSHSPDGHPEALRGLSELRGLIEAVIADDTEDVEDWKIGIHLGGGPIPETPQATIRLGAEQAEAIRRGELHPVEALITGQLRLEGDLGLILQLQAVAMLTASPRSTAG